MIRPPRRSSAALAVSLLVVTALAGCGAGPSAIPTVASTGSASTGPVPTGPVPTGPASTGPAPTLKESAMPRSDAGTPAPAPTAASTAASVTITLGGGVVVSARLGDSATARSLLAQLPLRLDFRDFGGQEKIATLPAPLDLDGAPDRAAAPRGTLGYYAPDQGLVLYYESVAAYPGIVPIGSIDDVGAVRAAPDAEGEVRAGT